MASNIIALREIGVEVPISGYNTNFDTLEVTFPQNLGTIDNKQAFIQSVNSFTKNTMTASPNNKPLVSTEVLKRAYLNLKDVTNDQTLYQIPFSSIIREYNNGRDFLAFPRHYDFSQATISFVDLISLVGTADELTNEQAVLFDFRYFRTDDNIVNEGSTNRAVAYLTAVFDKFKGVMAFPK